MRTCCSILGCEKPAKGRGWCAMHWYRWRKHGDPLKVAVRGIDWQVKPTCSVEGCERPNHAHTYCRMHSERFRKHADPLHVEPIRGRPLIGDVPGFHAVHKRLGRTFGPAKDLCCVDCGEPAAEWSYNNADPDELTADVQGHEVAYSLDLANYDPRCGSCHRRFDRAGQRARDAAGRFIPTVSVPVSDPLCEAGTDQAPDARLEGEATGRRETPASFNREAALF